MTVSRLLAALLFAPSLGILVPSPSYSADMMLGRAAFIKERYDRAVPAFEELSEEGNGEASFLLGHLYLEGLGVPPDEKRGVEYMRLGAKQGYAEAASAVCKHEFETALKTGNYQPLIAPCSQASTYKGPTRSSAPLDPSYPIRFNSVFPFISRYRLGVAYDMMGEENYAFICFASAYVVLQDTGYTNEKRHMEKRAAYWNILGHADKALPGRLPEFDETAPGCVNTRRWLLFDQLDTIMKMAARGTFQ